MVRRLCYSLYTNLIDLPSGSRSAPRELTRVDRRSKKGGGRPSTVPSNPEVTYADEGWLSWADWVGTEPGKVAEKR